MLAGAVLVVAASMLMIHALGGSGGHHLRAVTSGGCPAQVPPLARVNRDALTDCFAYRHDVEERNAASRPGAPACALRQLMASEGETPRASSPPLDSASIPRNTFQGVGRMPPSGAEQSPFQGPPSNPAVPIQKAKLVLSTVSGPPGTLVHFTATECPIVQGQKQSAFFHSAASLDERAAAQGLGRIFLGLLPFREWREASAAGFGPV